MSTQDSVVARVQDGSVFTVFGNLSLLFIAFTVILCGYIIYQRYLNPLSIFPGPFLASLTDLWQVREVVRGQQPYRLAELHAQYGEIVRYGPDKLSITCEDAINLVYVKNNKIMPKTEYYNAFGQPGHPNIFNVRDNEIHSPRRRQLLKVFSPQAVETYEPLIDRHVARLRSRIRASTSETTPTPVDVSQLLWRFMCDLMTDLIYGESWDLLTNPNSHPALDIHALTLWGAASGAWTAGEPIIKLLVALVPHPFAYKVFWQNIGVAMKMAKKVSLRASELDKGVGTDRKDILTRLVLEGKSKATSELSVSDIGVECFSFLIAGVHPPASAISLLLYHLLHNPDILQTASSEVQQHLPPLGHGFEAYSNSSVEQNLPYLRACIKESFRLTPGFTMPLARRVTQDEGLVLNGRTIPQGTTVAVCNHAFHHNANIWPNDHNLFDPSRWDNPDARLAQLSKLLMHFGAGTRQCIGKVLALSVINKVMASLLAEFHFELADPKAQQEAEKGAYRGRLPPQTSVGISDLREPLTVLVTSKKL